MKYKHHKRQLLPPAEREAYGNAVMDWLQQVLPLYGKDNVTKKGWRWVAKDDNPPPFHYAHDGYSVSLRPSPPTTMLQCKKSHAAVRKEVLRIGSELMREARPADERAIQALKRAEKAGAA